MRPRRPVALTIHTHHFNQHITLRAATHRMRCADTICLYTMARCLSVAIVVALVLEFGWQTSATGVIKGPFTVQVLSDMTVSWTIDDTEANITATASGSVWYVYSRTRRRLIARLAARFCALMRVDMAAGLLSASIRHHR